MERYNDFVAKIKLKTGAIILGGILVAALSFLFLVLSEKNFSVRTDYLVIQNSQNTTDTYALAKSAEYAGKILSEGIRSELFINEVIKTGKVNQEFLPFDKKEKLKAWNRMTGVSQNSNLGIISVTVFDNNQRSATNISEAVSDVITTQNNIFLGEGQNMQVKILSGPVIEKNPSISMIAAAVIAGFVFGIMLSVLLIFIGSGNELEKYRSKIVFDELHSHPQTKSGHMETYSQDEEYLESLSGQNRY